jgi:hypothetical protein
MTGLFTARARQITIEAVVTRADGTVENLGLVAYYHQNPLRRLMWWLRQLF